MPSITAADPVLILDSQQYAQIDLVLTVTCLAPQTPSENQTGVWHRQTDSDRTICLHTLSVLGGVSPICRESTRGLTVQTPSSPLDG